MFYKAVQKERIITFQVVEKIKKKANNPMDEAPVKIAILGDSVSHGCFEIIEKGDGRVDCVYDHEAVYSNRLRKHIQNVFPNCPVTIINAGISGGNAVQGAERVSRDVIAANPDLAIVCFGLNDVMGSLENYLNGLSSIFQQLREAGIDTIFMTPNHMCTYACPQLTSEWLKEAGTSCAEAQTSGKLDSFMQEARALCAQQQVTVCDCYDDWTRLASYGADTTYLLSNYINHPTREMHALFADRLFETIFLKGKD